MHFSVAYECMDAHERSMENENWNELFFSFIFFVGYLFLEELPLSYYIFFFCGYCCT